MWHLITRHAFTHVSSLHTKRVFDFRGHYFLCDWGGADIEKIRKQGEVLIHGAKKPFTEQEQKLLEILRNLDYGEVRIVVKGGAPVHVEEIKKSIKL